METINPQILILILSQFGLSYQNHFLVISDFHYNYELSRIMEIDPPGYNSDNDMDEVAFHQLTDAIKEYVIEKNLEQNLSFVIALVDVVGHHIYENREEIVKRNEEIIYSKLLEIFPNIPIINIFGNNDSFERNYGRFTHNSMSPYQIAMQSGFKNGFLSTGLVCDENGVSSTFPCISLQDEAHGYFTMKLQSDLLLIGLNTVMLSEEHAPNSTKYIEDQLEFLEYYLIEAHQTGMRVLIAAHIPFGRNVYDGTVFLDPLLDGKFLEVMKNHLDIVLGILVSHTHMEEFKIIRDDGIAQIGQYFTAGLSTSHGNSPSFKIYLLENESTGWALQNYVTYQMHTNIDGQIEISEFYDFFSAYCESNNHNLKDINLCLAHIGFNDTLPRYTVNNPNYSSYSAANPEAFYIDL